MYGGFAHDVNMLSFNGLSREMVLGQNGYPSRLRVTLDCEYKIIRSTVSAIFTALSELIQAYAIPGQSFGFYDNDGNYLSAWSLDTALCVGGTIITKPPSHGQIRGAEGTNFVKVQFAVQGETLIPLGPNQYITFQETLSFTGRGTPLLVKRTPATGFPFKQQVTEASWYTATQTGSLSTNSPLPAPMLPLWPDLLDGTESDAQITRPGPIMLRGIPIEWGVAWAYQFSSPFAIDGTPNAY